MHEGSSVVAHNIDTVIPERAANLRVALASLPSISISFSIATITITESSIQCGMDAIEAASSSACVGTPEQHRIPCHSVNQCTSKLVYKYLRLRASHINFSTTSSAYVYN